jgi:hypothetical protein
MLQLFSINDQHSEQLLRYLKRLKANLCRLRGRVSPENVFNHSCLKNSPRWSYKGCKLLRGLLRKQSSFTTQTGTLKRSFFNLYEKTLNVSERRIFVSIKVRIRVDYEQVLEEHTAASATKNEKILF